MAYQASFQTVHNCYESLNSTVLVRRNSLSSIFSGVAVSQILGEGNKVPRSKISNWDYTRFPGVSATLRLDDLSSLPQTDLKINIAGEYCWAHLRPSSSLSSYSTGSSTMLIGCTENKPKSRIGWRLANQVRYCWFSDVFDVVFDAVGLMSFQQLFDMYSNEGQLFYPSWVLGMSSFANKWWQSPPTWNRWSVFVSPSGLHMAAGLLCGSWLCYISGSNRSLKFTLSLFSNEFEIQVIKCIKDLSLALIEAFLFSYLRWGTEETPPVRPGEFTPFHVQTLGLEAGLYWWEVRASPRQPIVVKHVVCTGRHSENVGLEQRKWLASGSCQKLKLISHQSTRFNRSQYNLTAIQLLTARPLSTVVKISNSCKKNNIKTTSIPFTLKQIPCVGNLSNKTKCFISLTLET